MSFFRPSTDETATIPYPEVKRLALERIEVGCRCAVATYVMRNAELSAYDSPAIDNLFYQLNSHVMAEEVENETHEVSVTAKVSVSYPADWWQMWKQAHAPGWFTKRWPVKRHTETREKTERKTVTARKMATYPQLPLSFPDAGHVHYVNLWSER